MADTKSVTAVKPKTKALIDKWYEFEKTHKGRDKVFRTIQYAGKFLQWQMAENGDKEGAKKMKDLSSLISTSRKFFRFGKYVENFHKAYNAIYSKDDTMLKAATVFAEASTGFYYFYDSLQWLNAAKLRVVSDKKALDDIRNHFWWIRTAAAFVVQGMKLSTLTAKLEKAKAANNEVEKLKLSQDRDKIVLEMVRLFGDFWCPMQSLGYVPLHDGQIGIIGTIVSLIGWYQAWP